MSQEHACWHSCTTFYWQRKQQNRTTSSSTKSTSCSWNSTGRCHKATLTAVVAFIHSSSISTPYVPLSSYHILYFDIFCYSMKRYNNILWAVMTLHTMHTCTIIHCVSKKNIPNVFSYNSRKHWRIFIIFGRNVTEKASSHMLLYFSTSPN